MEKKKHAYLLWLPVPVFNKLKETAGSEYKSIPRFVMDLLNSYLENKNHE